MTNLENAFSQFSAFHLNRNGVILLSKKNLQFHNKR